MGTGKFVVEATAKFHQAKAEIAELFAGNEDAYIEGGDQKYFQHTYNKDDFIIIKNATCTEPGTKKFTCTVCGCEIEEQIAPLQHILASYSQADEIYYYYICGRCHETMMREAHTLSYHEITDETHAIHCSVCGYYDNDNIHHTYVNGVCACGKTEDH